MRALSLAVVIAAVFAVHVASVFAQPPGRPFRELQRQIQEAGPALRVLDANGVQVGDVVGVSGLAPQVLLDLDGRLVVLSALLNELTTFFDVVFTDLACTQGPFIHAGSDDPALAPILPPASRMFPGGVIYVANPETAQERIFVARLVTLADGTVDCRPVGPLFDRSVTASQKTVPFTPPFRVVR